jgi:hypothetical protein
MITVIQPNAQNGSTIIESSNGNTTVLEDFETGEITEIVSESFQQTTLEAVSHTVTEVQSNGTLIVNNPTVTDFADLSASNATYLYFGFSADDWKIRRVLRSSGTRSVANGGNNASINLTAAWPLRETLNYVNEGN